MKTPAYDPGWLRHRVTVEEPAATPDGAGGEAATWSELATVWTRIDPVGAEERTEAGHLAGRVTHRVTFRWRDDVTGAMRLAYRGRRFRILVVFDPDETRRYAVAEVEEIRT